MEEATIEREATATQPLINPYSDHCQDGLHQHCVAEDCLCDCHLCDEAE